MNLIGNSFLAAGALLNDSERRARMFRRLRNLNRMMFTAIGIAVLLFIGLCDWIGERNLLTAFFLFLPGQIWFLPLSIFVVSALLFLDWKLLATVILVGVALVWFHLDWQVSSPRLGQGGPELTVLTFNRGQRAGSLQPFKAQHEPDLIAMQEAGRRSALYLRSEGYSDLSFGEDIGEFMLLSRFPILSKGLVEVPVGARMIPVAGWFVVDFKGEEIVVYNVHLPTPRDQLKAFKRGAFLRGLWPFSPAAQSYQTFWNRQINLAEALLDHVGSEDRPTLVVGDFNTPDKGYIYSLVCEELQDAHEEAGRGFGWSFPGETRNPLSLYGPWLRIDHQFSSPEWRVLESQVEKGRKSQHLGVVAKYELQGAN